MPRVTRGLHVLASLLVQASSQQYTSVQYRQMLETPWRRALQRIAVY